MLRRKLTAKNAALWQRENEMMATLTLEGLEKARVADAEYQMKEFAKRIKAAEDKRKARGLR